MGTKTRAPSRSSADQRGQPHAADTSWQASARAAAQRAFDHGLLTTNDLRQLQRTIGNQAVQRLVTRQTGRRARQPGALQRILDITGGSNANTYYSGAELPSNLAIPKKFDPGTKQAIIDQLKAWADLKDKTVSYTSWPAAIAGAAEKIAETQKKSDDTTQAPTRKVDDDDHKSNDNRDDIEAESDSDDDDEVVSLEIPTSTLDLSKVTTLYFTDEGDFADQDGQQLSKIQARSLINSLHFSHIYQGHGPQLSKKQLHDKALIEGVSGKWLTDFDAIMAVALAYQQIQAGKIIPSEGFKEFHTGPLANSLNYRKRTLGDKNLVYEVPASRAKVGFKKQTLGKTQDNKTYYSLKTIFPFPEKVNDAGQPQGY